MFSIEIEGRIIRIGQTEQITEKFKKRELVIETDLDTQYPQMISVEFQGDKTALLDNANPGQMAKIGINLRGREYKGKVYNSIVAWRIQTTGSGPVQQPQVQQDPQPSGDDLPF